MDTNLELPRTIPELVDASSSRQAAQAEPIIIDLTGDDYVPPLRFAISNNRDVIPRPVVDIPQAGTSRQVLEQQKEADCVSCGSAPNHFGWVLLDCQHRMCRHCFAFALGPDSITPGVCSVPSCRAVITADVIERCLQENDTWRDPLLKALELRKKDNDHQALADSTMDPELTIAKNLNVPQRRLSMLQLYRDETQKIDEQPFWSNLEPFTCSICFLDYEVGEGVMLKNCLHLFCNDCIRGHIEQSPDAVVMCPGYDNGPCQHFIQDREIRALVSPEVLDKFLQRALKQGEANLEDVYHCQTVNCTGFVQANEAATAFLCEVCDAVNCIKCKAVHETKTCEQYQFDLVNDVKNQNELKMTEQAVQNLITKGDAMLCPKCGILIQKDDGCDYVTCIACKLGICYRTKRPRHPLQKTVNGQKIVIDGCHCKEKGRKCHPNCGNCH